MEIGKLVIGIVLLLVGILLFCGLLNDYLQESANECVVDCLTRGDFVGASDCFNNLCFYVSVLHFLGIALAIIGGIVIISCLV